MTNELSALHASSARLATLGRRLDAAALSTPAYPSEWTVGDVFSHLGSAATILTHLFNDVVHERDAVPDLHASVWSEWDAKVPTAQVAESLEADAVLLGHLDALDEERRTTFRFTMGPLDLDFPGFVGIRLNEHAVHTWDIEVAFDPSAVIPAEIAGVVTHHLRTVARFAAKPDGMVRHVSVHTTDPEDDFVVEIGAEGCDLVARAAGPRDLTLPAESFARLVYGRLDPAHTPTGVEGPEVDALRRVFRGV